MPLQTVSFLTYLLKSYADYIRPHEDSICKSIVNLLVTCSDSVSIRKVTCLFHMHFEKWFFFLRCNTRHVMLQELLISLKHVLGTDFRRGLFPLIDTLLEERYHFDIPQDLNAKKILVYCNCPCLTSSSVMVITL